MKKSITIVFLLICIVFPFRFLQAQTCNISDSLELISFYNSNKGVTWTNPWVLSKPVSMWNGVVLNGSGNVIKMDMKSRQISGTIPDFNLPFLQYLSFDNNQLNGKIPSFSELKALNILYLHNNMLSGNIPAFDKLTELTQLALNNNQLSDTIPSFSNLTKLKGITLNNNQLIGKIPLFSNSTELRGIALNHNQLSGKIPNFNLPLVTYIFLDDNQLSGKIPNFTIASKVDSITIQNNLFSFGDLQNWSYLNTNKINYAPLNLTLPVSFQQGVLIADLAGISNISDLTYTWYQNNVAIATLKGNNEYKPNKGGVYRYTVSHATISNTNNPKQNLTLNSGNVVVAKEVSGKVYVVSNCNDVPNVPLSNWVIKGTTSNNNKIHYAITDTNGAYTIQLEDSATGEIKIEATEQGGMTTCQPIFTTIAKDTLLTSSVSLIVVNGNNAPKLSVDISTSYLRNNDTATYILKVTNPTNKPISNVKVYVNFSMELLPITVLNLDTVYLGTVAANSSSSTPIKRKLIDNSSNSDKTYCASAQVFPNSSSWIGSKLSIVADSSNIPDSIRFIITNEGVSSFKSSLGGKYSIIIDDVILRQGQIKNLLPTQKDTIMIQKSKSASTYVCVVYQESDNPYGSFVSKRVEGVGTGGNYNSSILYSDNDDDLTYALDCQKALETIPAKTSSIILPLKYGNEVAGIPNTTTMEHHYIMVNTTKDTAKVVVLEVKPSQKLDIGQIEFGASSAPYSTEVTADNRLVFTFNNINLPPSAKDTKESIAFMNFRIKVPVGEVTVSKVLTTETAIKFSNIDTAKIVETISRIIKPLDTLVTVVLNVLDSGNSTEEIVIYPNPFVHTTTITVPETWFGANLLLYDLQGKIVKKLVVDQSRIELFAEDLLSGVYLCTIDKNGKNLAKGRIVVVK